MVKGEAAIVDTNVQFTPRKIPCEICKKLKSAPLPDRKPGALGFMSPRLNPAGR